MHCRPTHYRRNNPPSAPRTSARPTEPPSEPPTDLPRSATMPPTTLLVTERVTLRVDDYTALEPVLAALREGGCHIEEMELLRTDLEDVFVQIMKESR